jgi:hypothetical protein
MGVFVPAPPNPRIGTFIPVRPRTRSGIVADGIPEVLFINASAATMLLATAALLSKKFRRVFLSLIT